MLRPDEVGVGGVDHQRAGGLSAKDRASGGVADREVEGPVRPLVGVVRQGDGDGLGGLSLAEDHAVVGGKIVEARDGRATWSRREDDGHDPLVSVDAIDRDQGCARVVVYRGDGVPETDRAGGRDDIGEDQGGGAERGSVGLVALHCHDVIGTSCRHRADRDDDRGGATDGEISKKGGHRPVLVNHRCLGRRRHHKRHA